MIRISRLGLTCATLGALACASLPPAPVSAESSRAEAAVTRAPIRIDVVEPPDRTMPLAPAPTSVGIVLTEGLLAADQTGALRDDQGQPVAFESEITGTWDAAKTKVKWLLLHFRADPARTYWFDPAGSALRPQGPPLATASDGAIQIDAGRLTARIPTAAAPDPSLFEALALDGEPRVTGDAASFVLVIDDGKTQTPVVLHDWSAKLEHASPARASVKATGVFRFPDGTPAARLDLRYQFHRDETFVRLYHTLTWMLADPEVGAREMALVIATPPAGAGAPTRRATFIAAGAPDAHEFPADDAVTAYQDDVSHYSILRGDEPVAQGVRLAGTAALTDAHGAGLSVTLRHAWQRYPLVMEISGDRVITRFWPRRGPRMAFMPLDLMGERIYFHESWQRYPFSRDAKHFINNYKDTKRFAYTPEGAAWTHELVIGLHEADAPRSIAELGELVERPIALRQDPASAMRVPFMGMSIPPVLSDAYPNVERAVDQIGRLALARWESENNYGLHRFGMVRWSKHGEYTYYRWMDNTQYDQQLIPWLLFMRGGDRHYFDDGEITSRYCMDMNVNHYNTRGSPTGYMATCGGALPFPNFAFEPWNLKGMKVHFLLYHWRLTGYPRAKDVLDEVIEGAKTFTRQFVENNGEAALVGGREMYNMNRFWAMAYDLDHDPEIAEFARQSRMQSIHREYNPETNTWGGPRVYVYEGLLAQEAAFDAPELAAVMQRNLSRSMLGHPGRGIEHADDTIACAWAFDRTGDERFARIAWDHARLMADLVPDISLDAPTVPYYPYAYLGHRLLRSHLLPMLTGLGIAHRMAYDDSMPPYFADLMLALRKPEGDRKSYRGEAYVRTTDAGTLTLQVAVRCAPGSTATVTALGQSGRELATATGPAADIDAPITVVLPDQQAGATLRVIVDSSDRGAFMVLGNARIVYSVPADERHSNETIAGQQHFTPARMYTEALGGPVAYENRAQRPWAARNADTGELLCRGRTFTSGEASGDIRAGSPVVFIVRGCRGPGEWQLHGVVPYVAATREQWFNPEH